MEVDYENKAEGMKKIEKQNISKVMNIFMIVELT